MLAFILAANISICTSSTCSDERGNLFDPGVSMPANSGGTIEIIPAPQCEPGWALVDVNGSPWCARELKAPTP